MKFCARTHCVDWMQCADPFSSTRQQKRDPGPEGRDVWTVVKYGMTDDKPNRVVYPAAENEI